MEIVANNVANMNTPSYKGESALFAEYLMPVAEADDRRGPRGVAELSYVIDTGVHRNLSEGSMATTGNPLDLAISGPGYFAVLTPQGERHTRGGHFSLDDQGRIVTASGHPLLSDGGAPITVNPEDGPIEISRDGTISQGEVDLGRLGIVSFENERALAKAGATYFESDEAGVPVAEPTVLQGTIENSNVQPVVEMTRMIEITRAYESAQKSIDRIGELSQSAIRQLGRQPT